MVYILLKLLHFSKLSNFKRRLYCLYNASSLCITCNFTFINVNFLIAFMWTLGFQHFENDGVFVPICKTLKKKKRIPRVWVKIDLYSATWICRQCMEFTMRMTKCDISTHNESKKNATVCILITYFKHLENGDEHIFESYHISISNWMKKKQLQLFLLNSDHAIEVEISSTLCLSHHFLCIICY